MEPGAGVRTARRATCDGGVSRSRAWWRHRAFRAGLPIVVHGCPWYADGGYGAFVSAGMFPLRRLIVGRMRSEEPRRVVRRTGVFTRLLADAPEDRDRCHGHLSRRLDEDPAISASNQAARSVIP